jgi:hypothetical protein
MKAWTLGTSLMLVVALFTIATYFGNRISTIVAIGMQEAATRPSAPSQLNPLIIILLPSQPPTSIRPAPSSVASETVKQPAT